MEGRSKCAVAVMSGYGQRRAETLRLLGLEGASHAAPDKSRAGGVDARCAQLVRDINLNAKRASFYTTSSCSGRIVLGTDGMASDDDRDEETLVQQDRVKVMDAKLKTAAAASDVRQACCCTTSSSSTRGGRWAAGAALSCAACEDSSPYTKIQSER